ncbi:MAG TPA: ROK family protein [Cellulomonas sp.]
MQRLRLSAPPAQRASDPLATYSTLCRLVASGEAADRAALARATGLVRNTVVSYVQALIDADVLADGVGRQQPVGRGRPARRLALRRELGDIVSIGIRKGAVDVLITSINQTPTARGTLAIDLADGPVEVLSRTADFVEQLLVAARERSRAERIAGLSIALPAPIDAVLGRPVKPPMLPGWDGFPVADVLEARFRCPVVVDNDANHMALGEARSRPVGEAPLLFITIGAGIGSGLVLGDGEVFRGAEGAAGDIGHTRVPNGQGATCACGNVDCLETLASTTALATRYGADHAVDAATVDFVDLVHRGDRDAVRMTREAGTLIGEVLAIAVHLLNPRTIVVGGDTVGVSDDLLSGVRGVVYRRALPLGTRMLSIAACQDTHATMLRGGMVAALERALSPQGVVRDLEPPFAHR